MNENSLHVIADYLFKCLLFIRNNIFNENDIIKKMPKLPFESDDCIENFPIPTSHIKVILYLEKYKSSPISQIGKSLNISKSNMTPIIDKLIEYGLVHKCPDLNDRRIIRVDLTDKAYNYFNIFTEYALNSISKKFSTLSNEDINTLESSLKNLNFVFSKLNTN